MPKPNARIPMLVALAAGLSPGAAALADTTVLEIQPSAGAAYEIECRFHADGAPEQVMTLAGWEPGAWQLPARQVVCRVTQVSPSGALDIRLTSAHGNRSRTRIAGPNATTTVALR